MHRNGPRRAARAHSFGSPSLARCSVLEVYLAVAERRGDRLGPGPGTQLLPGVAEVRGDRGRLEHKVARDLTGAETGGKQAQDLTLTAREASVDGLEAPLRPEDCEVLSGRVVEPRAELDPLRPARALYLEAPARLAASHEAPPAFLDRLARLGARHVVDPQRSEVVVRDPEELARDP